MYWITVKKRTSKVPAHLNKNLNDESKSVECITELKSTYDKHDQFANTESKYSLTSVTSMAFLWHFHWNHKYYPF